MPRACRTRAPAAEDEPTETIVNTFLDTVNPALDVIGLELESAVDQTRHVICLANRLADEIVKGAHGLEDWEADAVRAIFAAMRENGGSLSMAQYDALPHKGKRASGKAAHLLLSRLLDEGYVRSPAEGELVPGPRVAGSWGGLGADAAAGAAAASGQARAGEDAEDEDESVAASGRRAKRPRADSEDEASSPHVKPEPGSSAGASVKPEPGSPLVKPEPGSDDDGVAPPRRRLRRTVS